MRQLSWLLVLVLALPAAGASAPMQTVERVDLERYGGVWYEIARLPNRFQTKCAGDVRADGRIEVVTRCPTEDGSEMQADGVARIVDEESRARLKVRFAPRFLSFLPFVWGDYWIIDLASDYSYAVVGEPERKYLWILSRKPALPDATYRGILERIERQGYDPEDLVKTPQGR